MTSQLVAVVVVGSRNLTRVTEPQTLNDAGLALLARQVARKEAGRTYYVIPVSDTRRGWAKQPGCEPLYTWHVGDGFEHHEGWWVRVEA